MCIDDIPSHIDSVCSYAPLTSDHPARDDALETSRAPDPPATPASPLVPVSYGAIVPTLARDPQVIPCFPLLAMQPYYYFTIILTSTGYYELPSRVAHILHRLMALPAHY